MLGFYNYTVWLTYLSLLSGGVGIYFAVNDHPIIAIICLCISGTLDMFDGKVARTKKDRTDDEKKYGIQIDSLTDLICFGVLPVVVGYCIGLTKWYHAVIFAFFMLFGMIRLAYFNVLEEKRQEEDGKMGYVGIPITTSAIVFPALFCFWDVSNKEVFKYLYLGALCVLGLAFIVKVKIPKLKFKQMCIAGGIIIIILAITLIILELL